MNARGLLVLGVLAFATAPALAQEKNAAKPLLRLEAGGPTSNVTALAFSPDGNTLYAAGFDKVVRAWTWNAPAKRFDLSDTIAFRVPIGPGLDGAVNALAVSDDGLWLAVGGFGIVREGMKFHEAGRLIPAKGGLTPTMRQDRGLIHVFNTRDQSVKILRGHTGPVLSLAFALGAGKAPRLISAAEGWDAQATKANGEVKVWDIAKESELVGRVMPAVSFARRPGLAMSARNNDATDLRTYLAWEDSNLASWAVTPDRLQTQADGKFNTALALSPDRKRLLTTSIQGVTGRVQLWNVGDEGPTAGAKFEMPSPQAKQYFLPLAVNWLGTKGEAFATLVRQWNDGVPAADFLYVVDARPASFGQVLAKAPLGEGNRILPVLAGGGERVAVGGFADHRVLAFGVSELLQGKIEPIVLRSSGVTMRSLAFVRKGNDQGLSLSEKIQAASGDVVFDFSQGKLLQGVDGWKADGPVLADYAVKVDGKSVVFSKAGNVSSTMALKDGVVTAVAVLPPGRIDVPLVAVASYSGQRGTTLLDIYHGGTGQPLRRYVGHLAPIRGLAFGSDGKLLASTAEDQTAIVWSLADIDEVLGKHGSLGDVSVELRDKELVVVDAAGVKDLADGDLVTGYFNKKDELKPLSTSGAFYEMLWLKKPGQTVKLRLARAGQNRDVDVAAQQGVDVRKPLFSLFFPRDAAGKLGDWLGWNAIGPYDASRRDIEKYLGWHFNTGKPEQPTAFAFIDQYRKEYFRPGLLKDMVALGDLPPPPKPPAPRPVVLAPGLVENGELLSRVGGETIVRKRAFDLHVTIPTYQPLPGDILTWQLDGGPVQTFGAADGNFWTTPVVLPKEYSATHTVTIRLKRTPDGWPEQEFEKEIALRVPGMPPTISFTQPMKLDPIETRVAKFPVTVTFKPATSGQNLQASFVQESSGRKIAEENFKEAGKAETHEIGIALEPGLNLIHFRVVNRAALGTATEAEETKTVTLRVTYMERKVPPPSFVIQHVRLPGADEKLPITGRSIVVDQPKATLVGQVKSEEALTLAEWDTGVGSVRTKLAVDAKTGEFRLESTLKPGPQTIRLFAKSVLSPEESHMQEIVYRPQLPRLVITQPEESFLVQGEGDQGATPVEVRFLASEGPSLESYPVTVSLEGTAHGKVVAKLSTTAATKDGQATFAKVTLAPGENVIRVRVKHAWGGDEQVVEVRGRYVRPPKVVSFKHLPVDKKPFVDLVAEVSSPHAPIKDLTRVAVNGRDAAFASLVVEKGKDARTWLVKIGQVPLPVMRGIATKSDIRLSLATAEGEVEAILSEPVVYALPPAPAPEVVLLEPALREVTIPEPNLTVRFKVASESPLTRVEVTRGNKVVKRWDAPAPTGDGVWEFTLPDVGLDWGLNTFSVQAFNDGGVRAVPLNVNVPAQPVRLEIDHILVAPAGPKIMPEIDGGFGPLPIGRVVLHGSVRWSSKDDEALKKTKLVRVFVNGFQQLPVEMKAVVGQSRVRKFEVPIVLNFQDNQIEIDLPDLKQDAANRRKIPLACLQPIRGQHLHVLVVAPQEKEEAKLVESLARGLKAQPIGQNLYKTPVFDVVRFYVLAKHVQLLEISSRLDRIAESLKERARAGNPNDLVMIYFQGKETVGAHGHVLWTSETAPWLQLTMQDLAGNYLSRFAGGQVLILDTISQSKEVDFSDVRFAYLRRPDPRPLLSPDRPRLSAELEKEIPHVVWLDQLATVLSSQIRPAFQSYLPEPLRNKIQLNPN